LLLLGEHLDHVGDPVRHLADCQSILMTASPILLTASHLADCQSSC
jgi:hypothetical protein